MKILSLLILIASIQSSASEHPANDTMAKVRLLVTENSRRQVPNVYSEETYKLLNVQTPLCSPKKVASQLKKCTPSKCLNKLEKFGRIVYHDHIVHGFKEKGQCIVSGLEGRYFVPKKDLAAFSAVYIDNKLMPKDPSSSVLLAASGPSAGYSFRVGDKECRVSAQYEYKEAPRKPSSDALADVNMIPTLVSYALAKESEETCKNLGATVLLDLEMKGLTQSWVR
jgi:hypothetical protein